MPATQRLRQHFVDSADGARIAVYEEGNPDGPTVVLVHGFPDSHVLWDGVVPLLAERFRIIRYDNRGVGMSSAPKPVSAYTMDRFADDFAAVTGELSPGGPVHVLAHDWGSVGVWDYLKRPGAGDRVATFTSVSGPSQDQLVDYIFSGLRRPWRPRTFARAISQALRFTYMLFFSIPVLAPLFLRLTLSIPALRRNAVDNIPVDQIHHSAAPGQRRRPFGENLSRQLLSLVLRTRPRRPRHRRAGAADRQHQGQVRAAVRVRRHPALGAAAVAARHQGRSLFADVAPAGDGGGGARLRRSGRRQTAQPRAAARADRPSPRVLRRHLGVGHRRGQRNRPRDRVRLRREGAELVVSDIDEAAVKDTAAEIAARGGVAHAYVLDVSDAEAVEAFAEQVSAEHGVPTSWSTTPASGRRGVSWTPRPSSSTACWTSTSAAW